ncbi:MAG: YdbL family protein [Candidatus Phaeomarinobacter sp.]
MRETTMMTSVSQTTQAAVTRPTVMPGVFGFVVLLALTLMAFSPAYALSLDEAKAQGTIGEMSTGYVGYPSGPSAAVKQLGDGVNLARKARYGEIAASQGASLSAVEQLAGQKLVQQAPAGQFVNGGSGWRRK